MIAARVAAVLGKPQREGRGWRCRCPIHGGNSLVLRDGKEGRLLVRCWGGGCNPREILAKLHRLGLLDGVARDRAAVVQIHSDDRDPVDVAHRTALARRIWERTKDVRGTPVARYLGARRITIPPPASLRWAPALRRQDGSHGPAMVARIDNIDGELIGISRTWLNQGPNGDWQRRDRAMLGRAAGGAVRLAPAADTLMVGEGVETCLAAMQATSMPAWAALSTAGLITLALPPIVRTVIILADHDLSGAGQRAARTAAARWLAEGRRVRIALPPVPGTDMADVLAGRSYARITEVADVAV
jgi:putative DNA primase/helicase